VDRIEPDGTATTIAAMPGRLVMELLDALLDLVDAVSTAAGIVVFWYTWVAPRRPSLPPPRRPSDPDELARFLRTATIGTPRDTPA
jgi:hypothetical protein